MRSLILLFLYLFIFTNTGFSGIKQLKDRPPTAFNRREPIKISLADFDENPFDYDVTAELLVSKLSKKFKVFKEIVKNTHNPTIKDTIFHFSCSSTKLKVYKSQGNEMVFSAQIMDKEIELRNQIRVGMDKNEFWAKFKDLEKYKYYQGVVEVQGDDEMSGYELDLQPNLIKISNIMGTADYTFVFANNALSQVNINVYMD
jgi:hypothetical protein